MKYLLHLLNLLIWVLSVCVWFTILLGVTAGVDLDRGMVLYVGLPTLIYLAATSVWQMTKYPSKMDRILNKYKKE